MKQYIPIFLLISFFLFTTCEDVLDCIINVRPELKDKVMAIGYVDDYYYDNITAQINNEANDNNYDYYFNVSGRLPEGVEVFYDKYREVIFEGIPKESGRFRISVSLEVVPLQTYDYDEFGNETYNDRLCSDYTSKSYVLAIK